MEHKDGNGKNSLINNRWGSVCVCVVAIVMMQH